MTLMVETLLALLLTVPPVVPQCLPSDASLDPASRIELVLPFMRTISRVQRQHHEATGAYLLWEEVDGRGKLRSRDGSVVLTGRAFEKPSDELEFRFMTHGSGFTMVVKDAVDPCGLVLFTDESGVIYRADPVG
jgi:hypothetical protein